VRRERNKNREGWRNDGQVLGKWGQREWDKHNKGSKILLGLFDPEDTDTAPFELLVNIYRIIGRSQKTWIFINITMKERKKIGKRENKENREKKKKERKKEKRIF